jgi:hypothetical protein
MNLIFWRVNRFLRFVDAFLIRSMIFALRNESMISAEGHLKRLIFVVRVNPTVLRALNFMPTSFGNNKNVKIQKKYGIYFVTQRKINYFVFCNKFQLQRCIIF